MGRILFWVSRPAVWVAIYFGPPRTRVVVVRQNEVLLVKDWLGSGRWKLTGGGLHRGEKPADGAVRELLEEVRLKVLPNKLKPLGKYKLKSSGAHIQIFAYWVRVHPTTRANINKHELSAGQWVSLDEVDKLPLTEATQAVLTAFRNRR